jgi:C-terminal processing protease CtpA/Prc
VQYVAPDDSLKRSAILSPTSITAVDHMPVRGNDLTLQLLEDDRIALLTINTFAYYEQVDMFQSFIDSCFTVIADKKIEHLILDLRGNDGGDPFCSSYLLRYLLTHPVAYFAGQHRKYDSLTNPLPLAKNHFTGHLYTLIDGGTFSTTGHFLGLLKYHSIGTLIGSESGATFTCTGSVHYENLKHTHLILGTAQKRRYTVAVENMDAMRGIEPDYFVEQSQQDLLEGKDTVLDDALVLIRQKLQYSGSGSNPE